MLILSAPALNYDYRQLYGQLEGRTRSGNGATLAGLQTWLEHCRNPLIPCLLPTQQCLNGHLSVRGGEQDPATCDQIYFSAIHRLVGEPDQAAALSTVRDEMSLWDFGSGSCDKGSVLCRYVSEIKRLMECLQCCTTFTSRRKWLPCPTTAAWCCAAESCEFTTSAPARSCSNSKASCCVT